MQRWRSVGAALMMLAAAGCHRGGTTQPVPDPNTPVPVEVESHFMGDVVIYLMRGNQRERLGTVTALSHATFSFPFRRLSTSGTSRLLAYPIAGASAIASDPLLLQPGQTISWTLESDLNRSSLAIY